MAGHSPSGEDIFGECCFTNREQTHPSNVAVHTNQKKHFRSTARIFPPATVARAGRGLLGQLTHLLGFLESFSCRVV